ncbi:MAG: GAF domain-containing protein [Galbitalea sp.]
MTPESVPQKIPPSATSTAETLCRPFVEQLPIDGASISVFSLAGQSTICVSDPIAARSETLQFELGEGPHWQALRSGLPVLHPDLADPGSLEWPVFREAARAIGIGALFAFPMKMGTVTVAVVDLYALGRPV